MRAQEFVKPHQMAKLEKTGRIVEILRHQDQVDFSDEPGWYLINLEPGKRVAPDMKWIPDSTRFSWVREFKRTDAVVEDITPNTIHKLADRTGVKWDNEPSFLQLTKRLTGKEHLDDLNQTELHKVKQHLEKQGVAENFADKHRQPLDFDKIYGKYLKVTDNNGNPDNPGFSIVTPLNGASWHWHERPEFKQLVKQKLNDPEFLGDHKYQQIIDAMAGNKFDPARHLYKENFADGKGPGRPGDSARHGIPKGATMAELERASHSKGRKGQLARWQLNMRRGHKK